MNFLRIFIISLSIVVLTIVLNGCSSSSTSLGKPTNSTAGSSYFRHRWWNYYQRGMANAEDRQWNQAIADFSTAIGQREADQRMARTYGMHFIDYFPSRELGILYFETGQYEKASEALERSIASYPSAKARFYLDKVRKAIIQKSGQSVLPPELELAFADQEIWTREDPVVVRGNAKDKHFVYKVTVDTNPIYLEGSQTNVAFQSSLDLPEGRHHVVVEAANLMDRISRRSVLINVDRRGPEIAVEQITRMEGDQTGAYDVRGLITDAAGVLKVSLNDAPVSVENTSQVPFQYRLPLGTPSIHIEAVDRLGNATTTDLKINKHFSQRNHPVLLAMADGIEAWTIMATVFRDDGGRPPEIKLKDWSDSQIAYLGKIFLDGVVSDPDDVVQLTINNSPILNRPAKIAYFNHILPLVEGMNTIVIKATDSNGNQSAKQITVERKIPEALNLEARLRVTVLPFEKQGDLSPVSFSFQAQILNALFNQNRFRLVERDALEKILQEQKLSQTALIDNKTALRVGRLAAAQSIITGNIVETRRGIEIVSRMIDTETSDILALEDVYSDQKDRQSMQTLANGMAIKYHHDFPLVDGIVISKKDNDIITDLGEQKIKQQRRILVYKESPIKHPVSGKVLGVDKEILNRAWVTMVDANISKATLLEEPADEVRELHKVITE